MASAALYTHVYRRIAPRPALYTSPAVRNCSPCHNLVELSRVLFEGLASAVTAVFMSDREDDRIAWAPPPRDFETREIGAHKYEFMRSETWLFGSGYEKNPIDWGGRPIEWMERPLI